ncbi:DUF1996 domain-containing protein [Streptomyces sp. NPDC058953]|uniref:DUF1996 domain-containing protein n=1 Tax=unclassified Streptomyces TaxID=2593676 RepID=UPI0036A2B6D9
MTRNAVVLTVLVMAVVTAIVANRPAGAPNEPPESAYAALADTPAAPPDAIRGPDASTGSFTVECGRNERGHRNTDNVVTSPGYVGGAHHTHDYVGNTTTSALSTDAGLAAGSTTCAGGDRSAYFWPVLRRLDREGSDARAHGGGRHGNTGEIVVASAVRIAYLGNPVGKVIPQPAGLRMITGDPVAATTTTEHVRARWGCSTDPGRHTATRYVRCPSGSGVTRTLDFPSCWNGLHPDSPNHRGHIVHPDGAGICPPATFPVPRLRITLVYDLPEGAGFAVDSFPEQKRDPMTDHAMFVGALPDRDRARIAECVNQGRHCRATP